MATVTTSRSLRTSPRYPPAILSGQSSRVMSQNRHSDGLGARRGGTSDASRRIKPPQLLEETGVHRRDRHIHQTVRVYHLPAHRPAMSQNPRRGV